MKVVFSLNHPHPAHLPTVGRRRLGRSAVFGRPLYGTTLRCTCAGLSWRVNEPPSRSRAETQAAYREHLLQTVDHDVLAGTP